MKGAGTALGAIPVVGTAASVGTKATGSAVETSGKVAGTAIKATGKIAESAGKATTDGIRQAQGFIQKNDE